MPHPASEMDTIPPPSPFGLCYLLPQPQTRDEDEDGCGFLRELGDTDALLMEILDELRKAKKKEGHRGGVQRS